MDNIAGFMDSSSDLGYVNFVSQVEDIGRIKLTEI